MSQVLYIYSCRNWTEFWKIAIIFTEKKIEPAESNKEDECFEIFPSKEQEDRDYFAPSLVSTLNCIIFLNNHNIYHVPIEDIIEKLIDQFDDISRAEQNHSDLIAGVYEG